MRLSLSQSTAARAIVLAVVIAVVVLQVRDQESFSPIDELQHFDYTLKSPSAGVRIGEQYGTEALQTAACRGIDWPNWEVGSPTLPECGDPQPDSSLAPEGGYNTAYLHSPVYYTATALVGEGIEGIIGVSPLTAYRLVGVLWLVAGLVLVWLALGWVHVGVWQRAAVVGLLGVSPMVIHASAFVNPDATALLGGGLVLVALLRWESGRWPWWGLVAASALAMWLKFTNAAAVMVVVVYLALRLWQQRDGMSDAQMRARARQRSITAGVTALAALISVVIWRLWQSYRQLAEEGDLPIYVTQRRDSFPWTSVGDKLRAALTPFRDQWIPNGLPRDALAPLAGIADVGLLVLLGAALALGRARSAHRALVAGVVTAMVGVGVVSLITNYVTLSRDPPVPGRYGLAVLPFAAVAIAPVLRRHWAAPALVGVLACATAVAMFFGVLRPLGGG
ncbi:MAG: hypothetical protein OXI32_07455 [bacterium]|nr:hypothetical protein [bacterium]